MDTIVHAALILLECLLGALANLVVIFVLGKYVLPWVKKKVWGE